MVSENQSTATKSNNINKKTESKTWQPQDTKLQPSYSHYLSQMAISKKPVSLLKWSSRPIESKAEKCKADFQDKALKGPVSIVQDLLLRRQQKIFPSTMNSNAKPTLNHKRGENQMRIEFSNSKKESTILKVNRPSPAKLSEPFTGEIADKILRLEEFVQKFISDIDRDARESQDIIPRIKSLMNNRREEMLKSLRCSLTSREEFLEQSMRDDAVFENEIRQLVSQLSSKRNSLCNQVPLENQGSPKINNNPIAPKSETATYQLPDAELKLTFVAPNSRVPIQSGRMDMVVNIYENRGTNLHSANDKKAGVCAPQRSVIYTKLTGRLDETLQQKAHVQAQIQNEVRKCVASQAERLQDLKEQMKRFRIREIDLVQKIQEEERRLKTKELSTKTSSDTLQILVPEIDYEGDSHSIISIKTPRYAV